MPLDTHPKKQFPSYFVDHMPLCLAVGRVGAVGMCMGWSMVGPGAGSAVG